MFDHFDLIAPIYDRVIGSPDPSQLRNLLELPTEGWMLDAGGGTGRVSTHLRPLVGHLVISDISRPMLKQAQARGGLWPIQGYVEGLPFPDNSFDRILVVDALHHFSNQEAAVRDLLRILKPGGRLVIEEPDINHFGVKLVALAEKLALMGSHFHSPVEIQQMVTKHGFPARLEKDGRFTAWIVAEK